MYILGHILTATARILHLIFELYLFIVVASVIISWVRPAPNNELVRSILIAIQKMTEPVFGFIRRKLPKAFLSTGLDFSPFIVILLIYALDMILFPVLMDLGISLRLGGTTPVQQLDFPTY